MHTKEDIQAKLKELVNAGMMREEDCNDFSAEIIYRIHRYNDLDRLFEEPLETWSDLVRSTLDRIIEEIPFDHICECGEVDEMKCPFCGSEDITLDTNITPAICNGVNEEEGVFKYECEDCGMPFFIYEKTEAVRRIITKTVDEMIDRTGDTGIW